MHINFLICFHKQRGLVCPVLSDMDLVCVCPWSWISLVWAWARACRSRWGSCSSCWMQPFLWALPRAAACASRCGQTRRVSCAVPSFLGFPDVVPVQSLQVVALKHSLDCWLCQRWHHYLCELNSCPFSSYSWFLSPAEPYWRIKFGVMHNPPQGQPWLTAEQSQRQHNPLGLFTLSLSKAPYSPSLGSLFQSPVSQGSCVSSALCPLLVLMPVSYLPVSGTLEQTLELWLLM